ncbi:hypothetical protein ACFL6U_17325 [Planctomycetota bacterium]
MSTDQRRLSIKIKGYIIVWFWVLVLSAIFPFARFYIILLIDFPVSMWVIKSASILIVAGFYYLNKHLNHPKIFSIRSLPVLFAAMAMIWWHCTSLDKQYSFLRDLSKVKKGMSFQEVQDIMADYPGGIGWRFAADPCQLNFRYVGDDSRYTTSISSLAKDKINDCAVYIPDQNWPASGCADSGAVQLKEGRVIDVSFSPD